jgi:hypothetical protein
MLKLSIKRVTAVTVQCRHVYCVGIRRICDKKRPVCCQANRQKPF